MKFRPLMVPALMLTVPGGLLAWLYLADPPPPPPQKSVAEIAREASRPSEPEEPALQSSSGPELSAAAPLPDDIRNVSPEGVSTPRVIGNLKRIEPSKRYLELKNPPVEAIPDGPLELVRVQVLDGGHLRSETMTVTLAYIQPLTFDETCLSRLGANWPCGARARTFLRGLIQHLKVTCEKVEELGPQHILGTCKRGNIDLSERLVRYGWADPKPDAPEKYANLAATARDKHLGKWQSDWLTPQRLENWSGDPASELPGLEMLAPEVVDWSLQVDSEDPDGDAILAEPDQQRSSSAPDILPDLPQQ